MGVVLLAVFQSSLPAEVEALGLLGRTANLGIPYSALRLAIGSGLSLLVMASLARSVDNPGELFHGWAQGGVRKWRPTRWAAPLLGAPVFSVLDWPWFFVVFGLCLLHNQWLVRKGPKSYRALHRAGRLLWTLRLTWFGAILIQTATLVDRAVSSRELALSGLCVVVAVTCQIYPRLSFGYCFARARLSPRLVVERSLWFSRMERAGLCTALVLAFTADFSCGRHLALLLGPYCMARWFHQLSLLDLMRNSQWRPLLGDGKPVMRRKTIFADHQSCEEYFGPRDATYVPIDCLGPGPLMRPLDPEDEVPPPPPGFYFENLIAIGLFLLFLLGCCGSSPLSTPLRARLTYQTRATDFLGTPVLFTAVKDSGPRRLLETLQLPNQQVDIGPETAILSLAIVFSLVVLAYHRWSRSWLGMLGVWRRPRNKPGRLRPIALGILGTVLLGSHLQWFWYPAWIAALCLLLGITQSSPSLFTNYSWALRRLRQQLEFIWQVPEPPEKSRRAADQEELHRLARPDELCIELGHNLRALTLETGRTSLKVSIQNLRTALIERSNVLLPPVVIRINPHLHERRIRFLFRGQAIHEMACHESDDPAAIEVAWRFEMALREHTEEFMKVARWALKRPLMRR